MRPFLHEAFGNPSSSHWASIPAKAALEQARGEVAALFGAAPDEIIFTSGASEANNLAIKGTFFALNLEGARIPLILLPAGFSNGSALRSLTFRSIAPAGSIPRTCAAPLLRRRS
jgi:hypothetical protein